MLQVRLIFVIVEMVDPGWYSSLQFLALIELKQPRYTFYKPSYALS